MALHRAAKVQALYLASHRSNNSKPGSVTRERDGAMEGLTSEKSAQEATTARQPNSTVSEQEDTSEAALDAHLRRLDALVGRVHDALPRDALLLVATGQGDTAECRRLQEAKFKRQGRVDGLPAWSLADEEHYSALMNSEIMGLCFLEIKR